MGGGATIPAPHTMRNAAFTLALLTVGASLTVPLSAALLMGSLPGPAAAAETQDEGKGKSDKEKAAEAKRKLDAKAKEVAAKLAKGLKSKEVSERRAAIAEASVTEHPRVIDAITKALKDDEPEVVRTALESLGMMNHPGVRKPLESFLRSKKRNLQKDIDTYVSAIRAVGRHGTGDSLKLMLDGAFEEKERRVLQARVFGAARMRSHESLEAIMAGIQATDPRWLRSRMKDIQTSLIWLTGKDLGANSEAWTSWWRKEGKTFKIPEQPPRMVQERANEWRRFWGEEAVYGRQKKRGDRG